MSASASQPAVGGRNRRTKGGVGVDQPHWPGIVGVDPTFVSPGIKLVRNQYPNHNKPAVITNLPLP